MTVLCVCVTWAPQGIQLNWWFLLSILDRNRMLCCLCCVSYLVLSVFLFFSGYETTYRYFLSSFRSTFNIRDGILKDVISGWRGSTRNLISAAASARPPLYGDWKRSKMAGCYGTCTRAASSSYGRRGHVLHFPSIWRAPFGASCMLIDSSRVQHSTALEKKKTCFTFCV